ncbi:hypothetical protein [Stenotrophomonas sp. 24(2023)]|uniref:hypothetical protein n=1 Tax=Stenotrophomonas sp. 24(2023) TaxID=3068324 RepID=UPI0027E154F1|nr:hypothetical protein [Stenotrophomonas sp. 24(2023)]WMJ69287.1 hypothetical protein Q9R17_19255 [Stenotrophomonas sp. 24(2023)]
MLLLLMLLLVALPAQADGPAAGRWGTHGMVVFGNRDGLYAMHLAMFHRPHDVQVVLRIHLADAAADDALRRTLARRSVLWTLAPERFDLDRLAPAAPAPLPGFPARLYRGHFERGGQPQPALQQVVVEQVLVFQPLDPAYRSAAVERYRLIGQGRHRFLVKQLDQRPDADLLLAVTVPAATAAGTTVARPADGRLPRAGQGPQWLGRERYRGWRAGAVIYADGADLR